MYIPANSAPNSFCISFVVDRNVDRKPHRREQVSECVEQFGWTVEQGKLRPSGLLVKGVSVDLTEDVRQLLENAYNRYGQGDYPGAMTAVCSALDALTAKICDLYCLGNPHEATYQERASRSFQALETAYRACYADAQFDEEGVNRVWKNYKRSINQAAYVLGVLRRSASDVHGLTNCPPSLVRHAIDCGTFIIGSITSTMHENTQEVRPPDF